jgi:single-stranded DNA-binding protein
MASLNRYELIGKLISDPELRYTPSGRPVASFVVEVENEQLVNFHYVDRIAHPIPVQTWGQLGELCNKHLRIGNLVFVEGFLITEKTKQTTIVHDDEFGDNEFDETKYFVQVVAKRIEFLDSEVDKTSIMGNKEKILRSIQTLENEAYYPSASGVLKALEFLKSLDFEGID